MLGEPLTKKKIETSDFDERIVARGGNCLVLNDEAHHTHDEESVWNQIIRNLHHGLSPANVIQLDLTATPRYQMGGLFAWTIYDYPLKQAILDNIVKRPLRGITTGIQELPSDTASVKYQAYLHAGVERWREYREALSPFDKKPLLFIMMNSTAEADDVAEHLRTKYPSDFGGEKLLVIHTDTKGEVSKKDLDAARELARQVDKNQCPVNAIVSVLMLREGWDVQNVTVIVGLRPYSSKANILPEQTIGRGLRMMFRGEGSTYVERVDIIGNKHFIDFVSDLEKDEDLQLETFNLKDPVVITNIHPDLDKMDRDILLPELSPLLTRKKTMSEEINAIDVKLWKMQTLPVRDSDAKAQEFRYEGKDILTLKMEIERDYSIPEPQTAQEVIGYYARKIATDIKLPSQFANIVPKVREFLELRAFGEPVDIETPAMIKAIAAPIVAYVTIKEFRNALRNISIEELTPQLLTTGRRLSETAPYASSRKTFVASKTIFNLVDPGNEFEKRFARCLEDCPDVVRFSKLPSQFNFQIDYTDNAGNLRFYEPDFVAVLVDGSQWILETKGREDIDVAHKDRAAILWSENASRLTETDWRYLKIPEKEFDSLNPFYFSDLTLALCYTELEKIWSLSTSFAPAIPKHDPPKVGG